MQYPQFPYSFSCIYLEWLRRSYNIIGSLQEKLFFLPLNKDNEKRLIPLWRRKARRPKQFSLENGLLSLIIVQRVSPIMKTMPKESRQQQLTNSFDAIKRSRTPGREEKPGNEIETCYSPHKKLPRTRGSDVRPGTEKKASDGGVIQHIGHARPDVGYVRYGTVAFTQGAEWQECAQHLFSVPARESIFFIWDKWYVL